MFAHHFIGAERGPDCLDPDGGGFYILTSPDGLQRHWNGRRVDHTVTWRGQRTIRCVKGRAIRLVFRMHRAKLFSFRIV